MPPSLRRLAGRFALAFRITWRLFQMHCESGRRCGWVKRGHKLYGLVAAFSSVGGRAASELEDRAARGQLDEARPLVEHLGIMAEELMRLAGGLSLETLRNQAEVADHPNRTAGP